MPPPSSASSSSQISEPEIETTPGGLTLVENHIEESDTATLVAEGLERTPPSLPASLLYDHRGSVLFEKITKVDEYYPTRTEIAIMQNSGPEMAELIGPRARLVEYGSGSSAKIRELLDDLEDLSAYIPVDISKDFLVGSAEELAEAYEGLEVVPVVADFTLPFAVPEPQRDYERTVVYFPGSTIGNMTPEVSLRILKQMASQVGAGGGLLIGVDVKKDSETLEAAYNDAAGITAEFNFNLLDRIEREIGGGFDREQFRFYAEWDAARGAVISRLYAKDEVTLRAGDSTVTLEKDAWIHTESSYKYDPHEFADLAAKAGFEVKRVWIDEDRLFSVQYLTVRDSA